ncbi:TPA: phage tail protein [Neisseria meningitidis]
MKANTSESRPRSSANDEQHHPVQQQPPATRTGKADRTRNRRNLIAGFAEIHAHKGTPHAIRQLFRLLQLGEVQIIERAGEFTWNGEVLFDGSRTFGGREDDWAKYSIVLSRPVSNRQAAQIRALLAEIAPLRCELVALDYRANPLLWNGEISFDGEYSFGAA